MPRAQRGHGRDAWRDGALCVQAGRFVEECRNAWVEARLDDGMAPARRAPRGLHVGRRLQAPRLRQPRGGRHPGAGHRVRAGGSLRQDCRGHALRNWIGTSPATDDIDRLVNGLAGNPTVQGVTLGILAGCNQPVSCADHPIDVAEESDRERRIVLTAHDAPARAPRWCPHRAENPPARHPLFSAPRQGARRREHPARGALLAPHRIASHHRHLQRLQRVDERVPLVVRGASVAVRPRVVDVNQVDAERKSPSSARRASTSSSPVLTPRHDPGRSGEPGRARSPRSPGSPRPARSGPLARPPAATRRGAPAPWT